MSRERDERMARWHKRYELQPPRYVDVKDAWCIVCRNEDDTRERCQACEDGRIEHEGVPPDVALPPATFAAWTAVP
jgi:hypothetical protein